MGQSTARQRIKALAASEGFMLVQVAAARRLHAAYAAAQARLAAGDLTGLGWVTEAWLERATDPERFLPGARSIVLLALPYHSADPPVPEDERSRGRIARYARGRDYHRVFERKLRRMARIIREEFGAEARATVDYGPLLERPHAAESGLGWLGKSTMLLVPGLGPWTLLGAIATTLDIAPDQPLRKSCGGCRRCISACPTGALSPDGYALDARKCISYHTIENRGAIPRELRASFGDWVFGCDDCLDSCPVGAAHYESHPDFASRGPDDAFPPLAELLTLDESAFRARFQGRPIMRAKRDGLARNACVALGNVGTESDVPALAGALRDASPLVRGHAAWALGRLVERGVVRDSARLRLALAERVACEDDPEAREEMQHALGMLD